MLKHSYIGAMLAALIFLFAGSILKRVQAQACGLELLSMLAALNYYLL